MSSTKAVCFDTEGTILDWHPACGLEAIGTRHAIERDWAKLTAAALAN